MKFVMLSVALLLAACGGSNAPVNTPGGSAPQPSDACGGGVSDTNKLCPQMPM